MTQITTIIFDLSEVLISGLIGMEEALSVRFQIPKESVMPVCGGKLLFDLCCGAITEDEYIASILSQTHWQMTPSEIKHEIRLNFHKKEPGMERIVRSLSKQYPLVLLSDHAAEWVVYIKTIHPVLGYFSSQFYSYELQKTKREPSTFTRVLEAIQKQPAECVFIDDHPGNISVAESVGMRGIVFKNSEQLTRDLLELDIRVEK